MDVQELSLYPLLWHLLTPGFCSVCVPTECLKCNNTGETLPDYCPLCSNNDTQCIPADPMCRKDFQVTLSYTELDVEEGDDVTLKCVHELPSFNLTFEWYQNDQMIKEYNCSTLNLTSVLSIHGGQYHCVVKSPCGTYKSKPQKVTVSSNSLLLLLICGVSALVVVVVMGLAMKLKLKRDNDKHKQRMEQRRMDQQIASGQVTGTET